MKTRKVEQTLEGECVAVDEISSRLCLPSRNNCLNVPWGGALAWILTTLYEGHACLRWVLQDWLNHSTNFASRTATRWGWLQDSISSPYRSRVHFFGWRIGWDVVALTVLLASPRLDSTVPILTSWRRSVRVCSCLFLHPHHTAKVLSGSARICLVPARRAVGECGMLAFLYRH